MMTAVPTTVSTSQRTNGLVERQDKTDDDDDDDDDRVMIVAPDVYRSSTIASHDNGKHESMLWTWYERSW